MKMFFHTYFQLLLFFLPCCCVLAKVGDTFKEKANSSDLPFENCLVFPFEKAYFPCSQKLCEVISQLKLTENTGKFPQKFDKNTWWIKVKYKNLICVLDGSAVDRAGQSFLLPVQIQKELKSVIRDIEQSSAVIHAIRLHAAFTGLKHAPAADWADVVPLKGVFFTAPGPVPIIRVNELTAKHIRHVLADGARDTSSKSVREINLSLVLVWVDGVKFAVAADCLVNCKDRDCHLDSKKWLHRILEYEAAATARLSNVDRITSVIEAAKKFDGGIARQFRSKGKKNNTNKGEKGAATAGNSVGRV